MNYFDNFDNKFKFYVISLTFDSPSKIIKLEPL
jgi:hypothetical protein